jgi:DNA polymerase IV
MPKVSKLYLPINTQQPQILHIDLNSCFATVEQQARPLLRGRPVGVTNRNTEYTCVVAASIEAKARGIKVGMSFRDAKILVPDLIMVETDPPKYHFVYQKLVDIMKSYSPKVTMKSIDEGIIDFQGTREVINTRDLVTIGQEIKKRLKEDVGIWMRCNIGIAPNRFLAKTAAGLNKPDGLDVIDHTNLRNTLSKLELTDLSGIAKRNEARLNAVGIMTPLQFLNTPADVLRRQAFKSVCGEDWYSRLRGHEVDDNDWATKTVGRQFVMDHLRPTEDMVRSRLAYLCETTGMKLRYKRLAARGIFIYVRYASGDYWYERRMFKTSFFSNAEIHRRATLLFNQRPRGSYEREIGVSCYAVEPSAINQVSLLDEVNKEAWLSDAMDTINGQYGEFTITYASSLSAKGTVKQKIPFGTTRYFDLLCNQA